MLYEVAAETSKCRLVRTGMDPGEVYFYYVRAYQTTKQGDKKFSAPSLKVSTTVPVEGTSTIKNLLQTALAPVGSTMYVWGGGWNKADTGAGTDAKRIGLSPVWRSFCTIYISFLIRFCIQYIIYTPSHITRTIQSIVNLITVVLIIVGSFFIFCKTSPDVMSSTCKCCGHVWIVVGQCKDGSVVLLHSSPAGVQLCGPYVRHLICA